MSGTVGLDRRRAVEEIHQRLQAGLSPTTRIRRVLLSWSWAIAVLCLGTAKRAFDLCVSLLVLAATSPFWALLLLVWRPAASAVVRTARVGRWAQSFEAYSFRTDGTIGRFLKASRLHHLPGLLNVLRGDMSFIGPRAVAPGELSPRDRVARRRYDVRPGWICLWWLRKRANIAYEHEALSDAEYVESQSMLGDFGLALRAIPAALYGREIGVAPDELSLLRIRIHNVTMGEAVETIVSWSETAGSRQVCFVNADCANIAWRNAQYAALLARADLTLGDGIGIKLAARALGLQLKQNVNGTDLFPRLCEAMQGRSGGLFLLGGRPGVAEAVNAWVAAHYPATRVCGWHHGYFTPAEEPDVLDRIRKSGATVLLVAFGVPKQDLWIEKNLSAAGVRVAAGVGGLFDFFSGRIPRAPQWLREMGLEWVYRLYQEPRRMWKRYIVGNFTFLYRVALERLHTPEPNRNTTKGASL